MLLLPLQLLLLLPMRASSAICSTAVQVQQLFIDHFLAFDRVTECCMLLHRYTRRHHILHLGVQRLSKHNNTGRQLGTRQCTGPTFASNESKNVIAATTHDR